MKVSVVLDKDIMKARSFILPFCVLKEVKEMAEKNTMSLIEYVSFDGNKVRLDLDTVKKYLCDNSNVTEQEFFMFGSLCKSHKLDPFNREAYLIKFGTAAAQMVVGKDVYFKRADKNPDYDGIESGIIVETKDGNVRELDGCFYPANCKLVGGWAKVYRKSISHPKVAKLRLDEYCKVNKDGKPMSIWADKPAVMIEKCAKVFALREAFPNEFSGMYIEEEFNGKTGNMANQAPITVEKKASDIIDAEYAQKDVTDSNDVIYATDNQIKILQDKMPEERLKKCLNHYGADDLAHLTMEQASEAITILYKGSTPVMV